MYKRRDWLFTHGADGGGDETSSSDSSSSESEGGSESTTSGSDDNEQLTSQQPSGQDEETSSSDADSDDRPAAAATRKRPAAAAQSESEESSGSDSDSESDERREPLWASNPIFESDGNDDNEGALIGRRLEDLSEDDFSGGSEDEREAEKEAQLVMQLESWAGANGDKVRGKPLKCILCDGSLVLNARVLKQHMDSKKHKKNLEVVAKDGHTDLALHEVFCYAEDFDAAAKEEEAETYQERMERVDAALKKVQEGAASKDVAAVKGNKDVKRRAARQKKKAKEVRKRPGKRQRLAMKEANAAEGGSGGDKKIKKKGTTK